MPSYYGHWFRRSWQDAKYSFGKLQLRVVLFSGISGSIIFLVTRSLAAMLEELLSFIAYTLAPIGVLSLLYLGYYVAMTPARIYEEQAETISKEKKAHNRTKATFKKFKESRPNIVFDQPREGPQYSTLGKGNFKTQLHYRLLQVWFRNIPRDDHPTSDAIANNVSAEIEFWDREGREKLFPGVLGQWAVTRAPTHISPISIGEASPRIDMEPGYTTYKLRVALKFPDEDECYPYAMEHFVGTSASSLATIGRNPKMAIPKGIFLMRVHLLGVNVKEEFIFEITNPGTDGNLTLTLL